MDTVPDSVRVFFAFWPTAGARRALGGWQAELAKICGGRTMRPDTLHATLVFLGEVATDRLEALRLAAEEISAPCFDLSFDRARYWGHNHILYAAPAAAPLAMLKLADDLAHNLIRHRFRLERRDYAPHVTLLRNARWRDAPLPEMPPVRWEVRDFVLVQSLQQNNEVNYRVLARFPLGDAPPFPR